MPKKTFANRLTTVVEVLFAGNGRLAARTAGMDATAFHRLVSGATPNPRLTTLQSLARGFGLPIAYLTGEKSPGELQPSGNKVADEFWLLMESYGSRQSALRNLIASMLFDMSARQRNQNTEFVGLSDLSLFPLDQSSPLAALGFLLNRENPKKEEIALVRKLYESETAVLELAFKRLKELGS